MLPHGRGGVARGNLLAASPTLANPSTTAAPPVPAAPRATAILRGCCQPSPPVPARSRPGRGSPPAVGAFPRQRG